MARENLVPSSGKKKKSMLGYLPFQLPETWTHDMCILANCHEDITPDRARMEKLIQAGLGKRKLVFPNKNASHEEVQNFLEEKIPKLKSAGGFHILRATGCGGGKRSLTILPPGKEGYSVPYLK